VNEIALTPLQLRAARNLLSWSRYRLAARMGISAEPIARFENEGWFSRAFDAQKARKILEAAGVEFFVVNGGDAKPFVSNLPPTKRGRGRPSKVSAKSIRSDQNEPDLFAGWISEEAFARQRGLSIDNLRAERRCADGPPFTRDGRKIFYNGQRFREWLARQGAAVERGGELP
jgi:transcriptional regulator with XRE-family HTH domain